MADAAHTLTPAEARILAVLIEKSKTTPDVYPLTVNSLAAGCNQKTSRDPVMSLSEAEIQASLEDLRGRLLVLESYGASGRVLRYAHNFAKVYGVASAAVDLLAVLMLRGPQTASELRANCERLHHFADASAVEAYLDELASREDGPLARKLTRQPGSREPRWAHLLCGEPASAQALETDRETAPGLAELAARLDNLEREVAGIRALLMQGRESA
jgi:uncharacterized protein YceH (UPF0502 family)